MNSRTVGKDTSRSDSSAYFQAYQKLLKQRERIDKELDKVQVQILKGLSKASSNVVSRNTYVPRVKSNKTTLINALYQCMIPRKEMLMDDILKALRKSNLYKTKSKYLYTMVNNKLNNDEERVGVIRRGVFVLDPTSIQKKKIEKYRKSLQETAA